MIKLKIKAIYGKIKRNTKVGKSNKRSARPIRKIQNFPKSLKIQLNVESNLMRIEGKTYYDMMPILPKLIYILSATQMKIMSGHFIFSLQTEL